jgi:hypothetical protein
MTGTRTDRQTERAASAISLWVTRPKSGSPSREAETL